MTRHSFDGQVWRGTSTFRGETSIPGSEDGSNRLGVWSFSDAFMATAIGSGAGVGVGASYGIAIGGNSRVDPGAYSAVAIRGRARGDNSISIGGDTSAESVAVGAGASTVDGLAGTALGYGATSTGMYGCAVGRSEAAGIAVAVGIAFARAQGSIAIGYLAQVPTDPDYPSTGAICIGLNSSVAKNSGDSIVIGDQAWTDPGGGATPNPTGNSVVIGVNAYAKTGGTIALGRYSGTATGALRGIAIGDIATCSGPYGIVIGASATVGASGVAVGFNALASGNAAVAIGESSTVTGVGGVGLGYSTTVSQDSAVALGDRAAAVHARAVAIGAFATTTAADRVTLGLVGGTATQVKALQVSAGFAAFGGAPPSSQPAHISEPLNVTIDEDAEARQAINSILAVLEGAGLVASA